MATDADAQAWIDDVVLDGGTVRDETAIDNLVIKLKADGLWAKIDYIWLWKYTGSQIAALKCLKTLTDATVFGPVFDDNIGFTSDGVDDYIVHNIRYAYGPTFTQNNAHFMLKVSDTDSFSQDGKSGNKVTASIIEDSAGSFRYIIHGNAQFVDTQSDVNGFIVAVREDASTVKAYRNKTLVDTSADTSVTFVESSAFLSFAEQNGDFEANPRDYTASTIEAVSLGGALTATEVSNYNDAITEFYTEVETPTGTTISGITQKDGVTLVADGTYVQHLYADDNKGTNETLLEVGQTTGGEVTFTGEVPVGKVRFIRIAYQDAGRDVVKEQFFTD